MTNALLGTAVSGLQVAQLGLETTGHNISNVNTPGYSRQRVLQVAREPQQLGPGFIGRGATVSSIQRAYDTFLTGQLRASTASSSAIDTYQTLASGVDNLLGNASAALAPALNDFFTSFQSLNSDPSSTSARQVVLSKANELAARFHSLDSALVSDQQQMRSQLQDSVNQINAMATQVASLNQQIARAQGTANGQPPNDLLDQRDELIRKIAQQIDVQAVQQSDGTMNITVANGQSLVSGTTVTKMQVVPNQYDPSRPEVAMSVGGSAVPISQSVTGGALGGILRYRREVLDPARSALGTIAIGVARSLNQQQHLGMNLNGTLGADLFNDPSSAGATVLPSTLNTASPAAVVSAAITDPGALTGSAYQLDRTATGYTLTRLSDGQVTSLTKLPGAAQTVDGVTISVQSGTPAVGDSFLIEPARNAAQDISVALSDPAGLAIASPVKTAAAASNTGSGVISAGTVNSPNDTLAIRFNNPPTSFQVQDTTTGTVLAAAVPYTSGNAVSFNGVSFAISNSGGGPQAGDTFQVANGVTSAGSANTGGAVIGTATTTGVPDPALLDPVTLTFNNPPTTFNVTGASTGSPTTNVPYTPGQPISFDGWTVTLSGTPAAGDSFTVGSNAGGTGDNRNGQLMAALQTDKTMQGATASFSDTYAQLVSQIGTLTQQAQTAQAAQQAALTQVTQSVSSVSGVNLDEEAANLIKYQQAYQASARVITVASTVFDTLLKSV